MVYVDTSVLVALIVTEAGSAGVAHWYAGTRAELISAAWCVSEFASALGIKQRTGQIDGAQAATAWDRFERLVANDLKLLPVDVPHFHRAAMLALNPSSVLRAGDALHLACAEQAQARQIATLDAVMARNARALKIKPVAFG